jgi:hypothetical protein
MNLAQRTGHLLSPLTWTVLALLAAAAMAAMAVHLAAEATPPAPRAGASVGLAQPGEQPATAAAGGTGVPDAAAALAGRNLADEQQPAGF